MAARAALACLLVLGAAYGATLETRTQRLVEDQPKGMSVKNKKRLQDNGMMGLVQFDPSVDKMKDEVAVLDVIDVPEITGEHGRLSHKYEETKFLEWYKRTVHPAHRAAKADCSGAPDCAALNRHGCFAVANTCGTCKPGYFVGDSGDGNSFCPKVDCTRAPDCESLNRKPCGTNVANTCGPCYEHFRVPRTEWRPGQPNMVSSNEDCLAVIMRPVVFVHGLGDTFDGEIANYLSNTLRREIPLLQFYSVEPGGRFYSMVKGLDEMIEDMAVEIRAMEALKDGFTMIGFSQGGVIARGYIERFNDPPVYNFISVHSPQGGIGGCPSEGESAVPCAAGVQWGMASPHDYWKGVDTDGNHSQARYQSWNNTIMDLNNEGKVVNARYRQQMLSLHRYVMVKGNHDMVVRPRESEWHGAYKWGSLLEGRSPEVVTMRETDEYRDDVIGLRTLDESGRLTQISHPGHHVYLPSTFIQENLVKFLWNGWYQDGTPFDQLGEPIPPSPSASPLAVPSPSAHPSALFGASEPKIMSDVSNTPLRKGYWYHKTGSAFDINPEEWGELVEAERLLYRAVETDQDVQDAVADIRANNKAETINKRISEGFEALNVLGAKALQETIEDLMTPPKPVQDPRVTGGQANIATGGAITPGAFGSEPNPMATVESPPVPIPMPQGIEPFPLN